VNKAKPFCISKHLVWRAYELVKKKKGAAGVDGQTIEKFDEDLKDNLYRIWNRMSSGSYFPPPVKAVEIPKKDGRMRKLGIPTISDRIAQTVVKLILEPKIDPIFHDDSYGYRPKKSAHQAIGVARKRCWEFNWVIDLDIKGFFDNLDHDLLMKALKHHTDDPWVLLYVERWLQCPIQEVNGEILKRSMGTPQGGVISPLLANLFLHYAFDVWIQRVKPEVKFERYADDVVIHCKSLYMAQEILRLLKERMEECRLQLHPEKTKIVYCKDSRRYFGEGFPCEFDFLGFTFKRRTARNRDGRLFDSFLPAISKTSRKKISEEIRSWRIGRSSDLSLSDISKMYNAKLRGWVNYFSAFHPSALSLLRQQWRELLILWALRKYKRFKKVRTRASIWLCEVRRREPGLFAL